MKKIISFMLSLAMLAGLVGVTASAAVTFPFSDVPSSAWYYDEVKTVYEAGIMKGKTNTKFDPTANMTRAEFVTVLCRLTGDDCTGMGASLIFEDTKTDAWYSDAAAWGVDIELVKGLPNNRFGPSLPVTRQEVAVFIERYCTILSLSVNNPPLSEAFKDTEEISNFAAFSVEIVRQNGIMGGDEKGNFKPKANISRAEVATVITRLIPAVEDYKIREANKPFNVHKEFLFGEEDAPLPYRIYIPKDYSEDKEYPLLVFLHHNSVQGSDNIKHLEAVANLFYNKESPVYDSIVLVPQCPSGFWWNGEPIDKVVELVDIINEKYSTDPSRQYYSGVSMGGSGTFEMLLCYPEKVSAAMPVAGSGISSYTDENGNMIPTNINSDMLDVPTMLIYDMDDEFVPGNYSRWMYRSLIQAGATALEYKETTGFGHGICGNYVTENDISMIEWLFEQRRETK